MAPKVQVPMDFGVHLRTSPTHNTLKLNTSEGGEVLASSVILSFNSPVIDHMTTTLHMTSVDMLQFSETAVQVFVDAAYSGTAEGINREIFRDINKMANVFEVAWLVEKCSEYFTEVTNSIKTPSYSELLYLFDEACFVYENINKKDYIELANDKIQELSTKKLDMIIELAGSEVKFIVQTLVNQLTEKFKVQGPCLPTSCKYLLEHMDLSVCVKSEESGFYQLFEILQELPPEKIKWSHSLLLKSTRKSVHKASFTKAMVGSSRAEGSCSIATCNTVPRCNTVPNLYQKLNFHLNFDQLLHWISASESVTNLLMALEAFSTWNYYHYVNSSRKCGLDESRLRTELSVLAKRKGWPLLCPKLKTSALCLYTKAGSLKCLMLTTLCCSKENAPFALMNSMETCSDPYSVLCKESKLTFLFKHPSVTSCNQPGKCGFILKTVQSEAALWKLELCTEKEDYNGIDVHFHEEVRAENMHVFFFYRTEGQNFLFPLTWLSCIYSSNKRDKWRSMFTFNSGSRFSVLYKLI